MRPDRDLGWVACEGEPYRRKLDPAQKAFHSIERVLQLVVDNPECRVLLLLRQQAGRGRAVKGGDSVEEAAVHRCRRRVWTGGRIDETNIR